MKIIKIYYQVNGNVQGVYFRKYTKDKANSLNIKGFITNDKSINKKESSVSGILESYDNKNLYDMLYWLEYIGSPKSNIKKLLIKEKKEILDFNFEKFEIIK